LISICCFLAKKRADACRHVLSRIFRASHHHFAHVRRSLVTSAVEHSFFSTEKTNRFSSRTGTGTPRRATLDPPALDDSAERMQEEEPLKKSLWRPVDAEMAVLSENLRNVGKVRDSSGEALVLLMEQLLASKYCVGTR
jgi:hypothetical protein